MQAPGAHFAEMIGVQLNLPTGGAGLKSRTPGAYFVAMFGGRPFSPPSQFGCRPERLRRVNSLCANITRVAVWFERLSMVFGAPP
jgi:hypothetical protein